MSEMKPGPRGVSHHEVSRALQHRRATLDLDAVQHSNRNNARVLVPRWWFEMDAYGAAVEGILISIHHALMSGSLGEGQEEDTLRSVRMHLMELDPALKESVAEMRYLEDVRG